MRKVYERCSDPVALIARLVEETSVLSMLPRRSSALKGYDSKQCSGDAAIGFDSYGPLRMLVGALARSRADVDRLKGHPMPPSKLNTQAESKPCERQQILHLRYLRFWVDGDPEPLRKEGPEAMAAFGGAYAVSEFGVECE